LSHAPTDCESDKRSNDEEDDGVRSSTSQNGRKRARFEVSDSDVNIDDDNDVDGWTKNDYLRNLEQFLGNIGLSFIPEYPTNISEIMNSFLGIFFFFILVEQSNLYDAEHADKYKSSSKSLALQI
jgi:hypothetical protein